MPDTRIVIRGLRAMGIHGVLPEEQARAQPFIVDLSVNYDAAAAIESDDIAEALDYAAIVDRVKNVVERERFSLLERLAARICDQVLDAGPVTSVTVEVAKPNAPLAADVDSVAVVLTRSAEQ